MKITEEKRLFLPKLLLKESREIESSENPKKASNKEVNNPIPDNTPLEREITEPNTIKLDILDQPAKNTLLKIKVATSRELLVMLANPATLTKEHHTALTVAISLTMLLVVELVIDLATRETLDSMNLEIPPTRRLLTCRAMPTTLMIELQFKTILLENQEEVVMNSALIRFLPRLNRVACLTLQTAS